MIRKRVVALLFCVLTVFGMSLSTLSAIAASSVIATTDGGTVELWLNGNMTSSQMNNIMITRDQSAKTATLSFRVIGATGTFGFSNITISKNSVYNGISPTISIDGEPTENSGFAQDNNNYYAWYSVEFSNEGQSISFATHDLSITFMQASGSNGTNPSSSNSIPIEWIVMLIAILLITISGIGVVFFLRRRRSS